MLQAEAPGRRLTGYPDLGRLTVAVEPQLTAPTVTVTRPALSARRRRRRPKAALEKGESLHRTGVRVGVPARRSVTTSRLPRSMAQRFERTGAARSRRRAALLLRAEDVAQTVGGGPRSTAIRCDSPRRGPRPRRWPARRDQMGASWCWWSFSRLCVVVRSRHSDLTADLPRRRKRFTRRFDLICPKTGSTVPCRLR